MRDQDPGQPIRGGHLLDRFSFQRLIAARKRIRTRRLLSNNQKQKELDEGAACARMTHVKASVVRRGVRNAAKYVQPAGGGDGDAGRT